MASKRSLKWHGCICGEQAVFKLMSGRQVFYISTIIILISFRFCFHSTSKAGDFPTGYSIQNITRTHDKYKHILTQVANLEPEDLPLTFQGNETVRAEALRMCQIYNNASNIKRRVTYNILGKPLVESNITLVSHMTAERTGILSRVALYWKGSMSVSLYCTDKERIKFLWRYQKNSSMRRRENIYIHHVAADGVHYPVNFLRNVALTFDTGSKYVFLNDVDFVPDSNMENILSGYLNKPEIINATQMLVIPAFELLKNDTRIPNNKTELLNLWSLGEIAPFHEVKFKAGHTPTNFSRWSTTNEIYEAVYSERFEPYLVAERSSAPIFPVRFVGRYYNKSSHATYCYYIGIKFMVIPDTFLVHLMHAVHLSEHYRYKRCAQDQYKIFMKQLRNTELVYIS